MKRSRVDQREHRATEGQKRLVVVPPRTRGTRHTQGERTADDGGRRSPRVDNRRRRERCRSRRGWSRTDRMRSPPGSGERFEPRSVLCASCLLVRHILQDRDDARDAAEYPADRNERPAEPPDRAITRLEPHDAGRISTGQRRLPHVRSVAWTALPPLAVVPTGQQVSGESRAGQKASAHAGDGAIRSVGDPDVTALHGRLHGAGAEPVRNDREEREGNGVNEARRYDLTISSDGRRNRAISASIGVSCADLSTRHATGGHAESWPSRDADRTRPAHVSSFAEPKDTTLPSALTTSNCCPCITSRSVWPRYAGVVNDIWKRISG
jgi:hypothetical protein